MSDSPYRALAPKLLWTAVVDQLKDLIASGQLEPGSKLPSERDLCAMLGVSRVSLREALRVLQSTGYVETHAGAGTFVSSPGRISTWLETDIEVIELFEMRQIIEPDVAGLAARRRHRTDIDDMQQAIDRMQAATHPRDADEAVRADAAFHQLIGRSVSNRPLSQLVDHMMQLSGAERSASLAVPGQIERAIHDHQLILDAIRDEDPDAARDAMKLHLEAAIYLTSHNDPSLNEPNLISTEESEEQ